MLCLSMMFHKYLNTARTNVKVSLIASAFVHESGLFEFVLYDQGKGAVCSEAPVVPRNNGNLSVARKGS